MKGSIVLAALGAALIASTPAAAERHRPPKTSATTLAVIGDVPYGAPQIAEFAKDIREINGDRDVSRVMHLGDIKDGSSRCDTSYFQARLADFESFEDPFVYTPGDNEWTDCHRASNGAYLPTERLGVLRDLFFAGPGRTLGRRSDRVAYQSRAYPENVTWSEKGIVYGTVHVVGSNDNRAVWFGDRRDAAGSPVPETRRESALRSREYTKREAAALDWIDALFDAAEHLRAPGLVLGMQADMWDTTAPPANLTAFEPIKAVIAERAEQFGKPVLLLQGDSHLLKVGRPAGQPDNVARIVVQGSTNQPRLWTRLTVDPSRAGVFSCEQVEYRTKTATPCAAPLAP